jgi:valyl-tRNA synthetase
LINLYSFIWNDFCSWYLEMVKPAYGKPVQQDVYDETISLFERLMTVLQPFMPFVTEEIWHQMKDRATGDDCVISSYPAISDFDKSLVEKVEKAKDLVSKIRDLRNQNGIKMKEELKLFVEDKPSAKDLFDLEGLEPMVLKMANLSSIEFADEKPEGALSFSSGTEKYFLEVNMEIDVDAEKAKITPEIERLTKFAGGIEKKLGNERFVQNAPPAVVDRERKKLADTQARLKILEERLSSLG